MGARKYTRQPLKYGKRTTKLQELKKMRNWQSNKRYWNNLFFNHNFAISRSSKLLTIISFRIHHIKHKGANLYSSKTLRCPNCVGDRNNLLDLVLHDLCTLLF